MNKQKALCSTTYVSSHTHKSSVIKINDFPSAKTLNKRLYDVSTEKD